MSRIRTAIRSVHWLALLAAFAVSSAARAQEPPPGEANRFFETKIRPVLIEHCYECHSDQSKPLQAALRLDYRDGLLQGGDSGPAIDREQPTHSLLLRALKYDQVQMPPKGKLPDQVIADFEQWLTAGAVDPRDQAPTSTRVVVDPEKAARWWSFQKVRSPAIPDATMASELPTYNAIDWFINAAIAQADLQPLRQADRTTLLRRVSFDLIGLPPSLDDVQQFVSDPAPDAYERLIDRLLASPRFGERWGRMWLDAARYADSNGADENHTYPVAWKYRDWDVRAFNHDMPYDRFVTEQLAGDLLPYDSIEQRSQLWTATGFLIIGPKMLAEQDKPKMIADIVDEQIDTVGQAFMGLTLGCARCHDHKFDPILARDYYALAGIFHSTKSMEHTEFVSQWNERGLPDDARQKEIEAHREKIAESKKTIDAMIAVTGKKESELSGEQLAPIGAARKQLEELEKALPQLPKVMAADEGAVKSVPIHIRGNHLQLGPEPIARGVPGVFVSTTAAPQFPTDHSGRLELARWLTDGQHPLVARVIVNRLWQGHFGEGLVRTPANFGLTGEEPTHPELLDYLSQRLVSGEWSLKQLHRELLLSAAYRRASSEHSPTDQRLRERDLENRTWARQNRKRLEVEPLRDAILAVGDNLDSAIGGQAEASYGDFESLKSPRGVEGSLRRTIYLPVNRAALSELLSTFDYVESATSVAKRNSTVVPHQSLYLMNNPLVIEQALLLSRTIQQVGSSDPERIDCAVCRTLGRHADGEEIRAAEAFLNDLREKPGQRSGQDNELRAWHRLCLSLMCANEFITID